MCSGRLISSCFTCGTRRVTPVTNPMINHDWGKDWIMITTNGTYPSSFLTQMFRKVNLRHYNLLTLCCHTIYVDMCQIGVVYKQALWTSKDLPSYMYLDEVNKNRNERSDIQFVYSTSCDDDLEKTNLELVHISIGVSSNQTSSIFGS